MSNTNTTPSAEELSPEAKFILSLKETEEMFFSEQEWRFIYRCMRKYNRLHLEAMRDSFCKEEYLDVDRNNIREAVNTYIKNNKL